MTGPAPAGKVFRELRSPFYGGIFSMRSRNTYKCGVELELSYIGLLTLIIRDENSIKRGFFFSVPVVNKL